MRFIQIVFQGDDWDDEDEAESIESAVQEALDEAGVDYMDVRII
jgi:hypothetical protein